MSAPAAPRAPYRAPVGARITASAARVLHSGAKTLPPVRTLVTALLMIIENPTRMGTPWEDDPSAYYAHLGDSPWVVLYTYTDHVTIIGIRRVVSL